MHALNIAFLGLLCLPSEVVGQEQIDPAKSLEPYYQSKGEEPGYKSAIAKLGSAKAKEREAASAWLRELLSQALQDEKSGKAPWRATPFWGSSGENPARNLRIRIAEELGEASPLSGSVPVLRWFFDEEFLPASQVQAVKALGKLNTPEAVALRIQLIDGLHANAAVVVACLKQIEANKNQVPAEKLQALCQHHRSSVRESARSVLKSLHGAEAAPFDQAAAMRSAPVVKLMNDLRKLLIDSPPADAPFVLAVTAYFDNDKKQTNTKESRGWIVKRQGDEVEMLTPFGWKEVFRTSDQPVLNKKGRYATETWWKWTISPLAIEKEVARVERLRRAGAKDFEFSERGGLTGQFEGTAAGLYEAVLAQHLFAAGKDKLAARVLFPALETLYRDDGLTATLRHEMGRICGYQMLTAFVGDRDYARAEKRAQLLAQQYPETIFHHYAVRLAAELPKRQDDFVKLKLPSEAEWQEMKKKMSRKEQIDFLCQRIRLLNFFQTGQPFGHPQYSDTQFAEPCGMNRNASWGGYGGKTKVINPVVELVGPIDGFRRQEKNDYKGLALTIADIPQLAPYLRDDWFQLSVSFWRDFAADRELAGSRELFAILINKIAMQSLCSAHQIENMSPAERQQETRRIIEWAGKNAGKSEADLLLLSIEDEYVPGRMHWSYLSSKFGRLVELKEKRAEAVLLRLLNDGKCSHEELWLLLSYARQLNAEPFKKRAEQLFTYDDENVRLQAALLLHATGERERSHKFFAQHLEKGRIWYSYELSSSADVLRALLKEGTPESRRVVLRIFTNPELDHGTNAGRPWMLAILAKAGFPEAYRHYLRLLEGPNSEYIAAEIVGSFAWEDPSVQAITKEHETNAARIPPLKSWLQSRIKALSTR